MDEQYLLESAATSYHTSPTSPSDLMGTPWGFIPIVDAAKNRSIDQ